ARTGDDDRESHADEKCDRHLLRRLLGSAARRGGAGETGVPGDERDVDLSGCRVPDPGHRLAAREWTEAVSMNRACDPLRTDPEVDAHPPAELPGARVAGR